MPASQSVEGVQQVLGRATPPGQLGDQNRIDLPRLRQIDNPVAGGTVGGCARGGFFEYPYDVISTAFGKSGQFRHLPLAGLIGCGNPSIDGGALSQLNLLGFWSCKSLILLMLNLS